MRTIVVIPTYEEAENVAVVLRAVREAAPEADVLVVDDNSPDGTSNIAKTVAAELGQIDVLTRPSRGGFGGAYRAGFESVLADGYEIVVQMDADLSHSPSSLPALLEVVAQGADVAIGSRYIKGGTTPDWPVGRRLLSRLGNVFSAAALGLEMHDATAGFRAYRADILRALDVGHTSSTGYGFQLEISYGLQKLGACVVEVPISFHDRIRGKTKMSLRIVVEALSLVAWWAIRDRVFRRPQLSSVHPTKTQVPPQANSRN